MVERNNKRELACADGKDNEVAEYLPCRNKNESCGENTDCCTGLDLYCGTVTVSSGQLEKRCSFPNR